jgi:hypothetical protein
VKYRFQKHYTLDEARAYLPELRRLLREAQRRRVHLQQLDQKLGSQQEQTGGDLGGKDVGALVTEMTQLNAQILSLQERGIELKDLDRGLVDFPHLRDGREVFLCFELEDDDIEFWHEIEAGYAGRERL